MMFLSSFVMSAAAFASQPMIADGRQWNVVNMNADKQPGKAVYTTQAQKIEGDSVVDGVTYKKLFCSTDSELSEWNFEVLVREGNGQVWVMTDGREHLLYDFNMKVDDRVPVTSVRSIQIGIKAQDYIVAAVDTVEDNNGVRIARFELTDGIHSTVIYDGYGARSGWMRHENDQLAGDGTDMLRCVYDPDKQLGLKLNLPWDNVEFDDDECYIWATTTTAAASDVPALSGSIVYDNASQAIRLDTDGAASLTVYNAHGLAIFQTSVAGNSIPFAARTGIYIVTVTNKDGSNYAGKMFIR